MGDNTIHEDNLKKLEEKAGELCKKKFPFQRLVLSKEQALQMFAANPFKVRSVCIHVYMYICTVCIHVYAYIYIKIYVYSPVIYND